MKPEALLLSVALFLTLFLLFVRLIGS